MARTYRSKIRVNHPKSIGLWSFGIALWLGLAMQFAPSLGEEQGEFPLNSKTPIPRKRYFDKAALDSLSPERRNWLKGAYYVQFGDIEKLEALLGIDDGLATRKVDEAVGATLLHVACEYDQVGSIEILLKRGADLTAKAGISAETPLHVAARTDSVNAVKLLLDKGVDINILGHGPWESEKNLPKVAVIPKPYASPLDLAASAGSERVVELLLRRGAKLDVNPAASAYSALHRAMEGQYNVPGVGNRKRLVDPTTSASRGNRKVIELLLGNGANVTDLDFWGNTAFHIGVRRRAFESVEYLLTNYKDKIDVNETGQFGFTPLQLVVSERPRYQPGTKADNEAISAIENQAKLVIDLLVKHGADMTKTGGPSNPPKTAFDIAVQEKWGEPILKLLRP